MGGEEPPHRFDGQYRRVSPRDGASTELVTLKVRIPEACYGAQAEAKRKRRGARPEVSATKKVWWHHAPAARVYARRGERGDRQPSRTGEEQKTPER